MSHLRRLALLVVLAAVVAAQSALRAQPERDRDAATQASDHPSALSLAAPNVTVLSYGLTAEPDTNAVSPDASGDVGATQYLLAANGRIRSFSKLTGAADDALNATTDQFFITVRGGAATTTPRVRYDRRARRWLVLMTTAVLPNRYLLAVSTTATAATGDWIFLQWTNTRTQGGVGGGAACLGDDPTLALDEDAIYVGVNQRCGATLNTLTFDSTSLFVLRRSSVLAGSVSDRTTFDELVASPTSAGIYAPQGVTNFDDNTDQGYVIGVDNLAKGRLVLRRILNPSGTPTLSADVVVTQDVDPTGDPIDVPHIDGVLPLEGLDHRLGQAVIRNGRLWTSHHFEVDSFGEADVNGNRNGVRWYELTSLTGTPSQVQSGTVWDPAGANPASYWTSAIMPSGQGHVALGMSTAGALRRVNAAVTGRMAGDAIGTMAAPSTYTANTAFTYNLQGAPATSQEWSRTSSTSLDPNDDMTLWTLQQFVDGPDSWGLQLVRIQAPPPASIAVVAPNTLASGLTGASVTVTGTAVAGAGFFDPGAGFVRRLAASFGGAGVSVTNVAYTSPTSITLTVNTVGAIAGPRTLTVTNPDGQATQLAGALTISGAAVNQPPVAVNDAGSSPFNAVLNVPAPGVLANDSDPEGQPLSAELVTTAAHGSLTLSASGAVLYVPAGGFTGTDSFTYRASDGVNLSNVATVTISVGVNRPPVFTLVPASRTLFDPGGGVSSGPLAFSVSDPDGTAVTVSASSSNTAVVPAAGVVLGGAGTSRTVTVSTAGATTLGASTITLTASDGSATAVASFTVTVMTSTVPGAPQNLVAVVSRNTVFFTWQPPVSAAGEPVQTYVLDAGGAPGTTLLSLPLGNVLSFSATVPDAVYYVRLRAITPAGSGPASNEVQIALGPDRAPAAAARLVGHGGRHGCDPAMDREPAGRCDRELSAPGRYRQRPGRRRGVPAHGDDADPVGERAARHLLRAPGRRERRRLERAIERGDRDDRRRDLHDSRGADRAAGDQRRWGDQRELEPGGGGRDSAAVRGPGRSGEWRDHRRRRPAAVADRDRRRRAPRSVLRPRDRRELVRRLGAVGGSVGRRAVVGQCERAT